MWMPHVCQGRSNPLSLTVWYGALVSLLALMPPSHHHHEGISVLLIIMRWQHIVQFIYICTFSTLLNLCRWWWHRLHGGLREVLVCWFCMVEIK